MDNSLVNGLIVPRGPWSRSRAARTAATR